MAKEAAEVKMSEGINMTDRVRQLEQALAPFARLPFESEKPPEFVVYALARSGGQVNITVRDIKAAKEALGL
jgi:hypothetical protein